MDVESTTPRSKTAARPASKAMTLLLMIIAFCAVVVVAELAALIAVTSDNDDNDRATVSSVNGGSGSQAMPNIIINTGSGSSGSSSSGVPDSVQSLTSGENVCAGKDPGLANAECVIDAIVNVGPQAGANVTKGYNGGLATESVPITTPYFMQGMCPVNVHWHLGAEHYSAGQFDENGDGPNGGAFGPEGKEGDEDDKDDVQPGYRCNLYDAADTKFTREYDWKHCVGMQVGETYEVHWPHSAAGACGTPNQYQTPFADGVFCMDGVLGADLASQIGVQAQVFTVVNDESYFWPDLMRGMIVDGEMGQDVARYTGSTTGSSRNNEVCSSYSPITWQVDRKCHLVSASTFDKMCADMKAQRDDMSKDLYPHGSRQLVADELAANNHQRRRRHA